jgi:hypothetical protein
MQRYIKRIFSLLLVAALIVVTSGTPVLAQSANRDDGPSAEEMAADAVVVRPVGIVATGVGFVLWVVALPFSVISDSNERAWDKMVVDPAKYTFQRPLGEF